VASDPNGVLGATEQAKLGSRNPIPARRSMGGGISRAKGRDQIHRTILFGKIHFLDRLQIF
jgi:hypothetical protein